MIELAEESVDFMIKRLDDAIQVCYDVVNDPIDKGYPFAVGYSRSCMLGIKEHLQELKND
jgi:hypothetical protein